MFEKLIHTGLQLAGPKDLPNPEACIQQEKQLRKLLKKARKTAFGQHYRFKTLLKAPDIRDAFRRDIPALSYDDFYEQWWSKARNDIPDVTWPGVVPYYALSSGTSGASSKYIPVTKAMLKAMKKGSRRMFFNLGRYDLPARQLRREMLMVGSSTAPSKAGLHYEGDLSGIVGLNRPRWMERYYRPGRDITDLPEWQMRIEAIVEAAPSWDIGFVVGNPAWVQMIFERIIERYQLAHIHQMWPHFEVYVHGGVFFEPYRASFEPLLGKKVQYIDSYLASEGFFAFETRPGSRTMHLQTNCGVYFEFVPFKAPFFDEDGNLQPNAHALTLGEVKEGEDYALLISTCAGAWRYLLGDTIRFTNVHDLEFRITGRTKQFLSVCGEHLSVDNLNEAVRQVNDELNAQIREFAVAGVPHGSLWAHQWYISTDHANTDKNALVAALDRKLCELNDDYAIERQYALPEIKIDIIDHGVFYNWLAKRGKLNGQAKIPRVLKGNTLADWQQHLNEALV